MGRQNFPTNKSEFKPKGDQNCCSSHQRSFLLKNSDGLLVRKGFIMPGRQSTGPPSSKKAKPQKQKTKRTLNALAIAEAQNPVRSKIRKSRLGQTEAEPTKRKRADQDEDEDSDLEGGGERFKRRRGGEKDQFGNEIEVGSDSSGNEWTIGKIDDDDDSDLDSDEAMGESDKERYDGFTFRGSSALQSGKKRQLKFKDVKNSKSHVEDIDLRENGEEFDNPADGDDDLGEDAVDLADMLDASDSDHEDGQETFGYGSSSDEADGSGGDSQNSDDEENDRGEEDTLLSFSGNEEDPEDPGKLASLQALVSKMNQGDERSSRSLGEIDAQESAAPSDLPLSSKRKLTAADLLSSKTDPELRKSIKMLVDNEEKRSSKGGLSNNNDVPLPKRQQDRIDRAAAYEKSKETLSRWIDTVKHNRRAEHLSFPLKEPNSVIAQGTKRLLPTSHTKPLTDLEGTIQNILQDSGLAAPEGKSEDQIQAFEELRIRKMPLEEAQTRRAELRRARELLFREEIRQKRINKIKSKTYRKVHRKERERMAQQEKDAMTAAGVDDSDAEQERNDRQRAEERMGARHRESRWAKGVKDSGRARWDEDARGGVTEMARKGEELRRRIEGKRVGGDDDEAVLSDSGSDDQNDIDDRLRRLEGDDIAFDASSKGGRLANMDFMKGADANRKAQNKEDLERLRREEAGEDTPSDGGSEEGLGRRVFGPSQNRPATTKNTTSGKKSEFEEREGSDAETEAGAGDTIPEAEADLEVIVDSSMTNDWARSDKKQTLAEKQKQNASRTTNNSQAQSSENPWLTSTKSGANSGKKRVSDSQTGAIISNNLPGNKVANGITAQKEKQPPRSALKGSRDVEKALQTKGPLKSKSSQPAKSVPAEATIPAETSDNENEDTATGTQPFILRNSDLIRKAFAGDAVTADFEREKLANASDEDFKFIDSSLPGWGSWTGAGVHISKKAQKRNAKYNTKTRGIAKDKRKDAKLDKVIINEKRVKKNGKYLASQLPHPFETRQQYERSLRLPVGPEWTTKETFQGATKPRILMKQGVIAPMRKPII